MPIGKFNRRPTFYNESYVTDAGGGPSSVETVRWQVWAEIQDRSGNTYAAQATELMRYDYRVKVRFDGRFTSQTWMIYEDQICKCEQMTIETEGYKNYLVLRYSKIEQNAAVGNFRITEAGDFRIISAGNFRTV